MKLYISAPEEPVRIGKKLSEFDLGRGGVGFGGLHTEREYFNISGRIIVGSSHAFDQCVEADVRFTRAEAQRIVAGLTEALAAPANPPDCRATCGCCPNGCI